MPKANPIKAQGTAYKLLRKYAQLEAAPVELEAIACGEGMQFGIAPLNGCEARLVRNGAGEGFARISSKIKEPGQVRFALAHELGHFMMHIGASQTQACTRGNLTDYTKSPMEIEANIFAGEILMPKKHFQDLAANVGPTFAEIGALAQKFNVSMSAAILRYIDLGPISEMSIVCIGPDKRVKWSKVREGNWDFWVQDGMTIPGSSMAECAFLGQDGVDVTTIDPSVWFRKSYGIEVTEECLYMPEYRSVLSLLVIERE